MERDFGDCCQDNGIILPIPFEAANVMMNVQSVERTFIDKIFAICDYRIQDMQDRDSRHLYDICKLLPKIKLDQELDELIDTVREDRMLSRNNPSAQLNYHIPEMLKEIIASRFYESDYRNVTQKLLYENISYDYAVENGIAVVSESDVFLYKNMILEGVLSIQAGESPVLIERKLRSFILEQEGDKGEQANG